MDKTGFSRELLGQGVDQRIAYFKNYTMAHPRLLDVYLSLKNVIYHSPASLIFVFGPTGVGKTTLLRRLIQKIIEAALPNLEFDPGRIPIVGIEAMSPEFSQFDWKDFYIRTLKALNDPFIERKDSYRGSKLSLRHAVESALINRHPDAFYIDEAHHLAKLASGRKLKDQPEALKSLSTLASVKIIMVGTYDLMPLIDLGDQLCRRSKTVHFSRYNAECESDVYKNILQTFQNHLPIAESPELAPHWEYFYERSIGCVGILKDWLLETLSVVLTTNEKASTITLKDLKRHEPKLRECMVMLKAAQKGESQLRESQSELEELRAALKLSRKSPLQNSEMASIALEQQQTAPKSRRQSGQVGQSNPRRYEVGHNEPTKC